MTHAGHILIVDDTRKNIQVLGTILRNEGYSLSVAADGEQALSAVERARPDLILLDVIMPVLDGFETCKRLKSNPETAAIPVIFLTAKVESTDIVRGLELGAVDYVTKPFNATELLKRVATHLTITFLQREREERIESLSTALAEIERLHREQDAFLRHEVNNVVGPISGYADLLASQAGAALNERQHTWLSKIREGTTSIQHMLEDMKKLQTFERNDAALSLRHLDLVELLQQVIRDVGTATENAVPVGLRVPDHPLAVDGDPSFLPGVFTNLIKNAVEHVAGTEVLDTVNAVHVSAAPKDNKVVVRVVNAGPPVPPDRLATFFEKFNSTKTDHGGTGLGTSYAALVTKAHGGDVSVTSDATNGTCVCVTLPGPNS